MAVTLRSLDTVIGLKRRRITKLEALAAEQARHVKACEEQLAEAEQRKAQAEEVERHVGEAIHALSTRAQGFRPSDLVTLQHVLEMRVTETKAVVKQVQAAEKQVEVARETVRATRRQIEKAEQQFDQLGELREKLAQEIFLAAEDVQDEESEEASVARMIQNANDVRALEAQEALEATR